MSMDSYLLLSNQDHTFVIAEAGSNWKCGSYEQDLNQAKNLIEKAARAGADAVKFQTYRADNVYALNAGKSNYLSNLGISEDISTIFKKLEMPYEMIEELEKICKKNYIMFMSTPFSIEDANAIDPYVLIHKIASYEINHLRLLEKLALTNKPIILSTGASDFDDIDFAINTIRQCKNEKIAILQCTAKYPAPLESMNLLTIPKIKEKYNVPVGLSDHSLDPIIAPLVAIGEGATIIEKHFTLDRNLPGPDHQFALEPDELKFMINCIRQADKAKGDGEKRVLGEEKELYSYAKRSLQATKNIEKGEILKEGENFAALRPGKRIRGLDARYLSKVDGRRAKHEISSGDGIIDYD